MTYLKQLLFGVLFLLSGFFSTVDANAVGIDSLLRLLSTTKEPEQASIFNELSNRLWLSNTGKSIEYAQKALMLSKRYDQPENRYNALHNLAVAYLQMDTLNLALKYNNLALNVARNMGDSMLIARAYFELGTTYSERGLHLQALEYLLDALKTVESMYYEGDSQNTSRPIAFISNNIGVLYSRLGSKDKALQYYRYSLKIKTKLGDSAGIANMLNNIGLIYAENKMFKKANDYYDRSIEIKERLNDSAGLSETIFNRWELLIELKKYHKALDYYDTVNLFVNYLKGRTLINFHNNIANVFLNLHKPHKAYIHLEKAIKLAKETNTLDLLAKSYQLLSEYYAQVMDYKQAFYYQGMYVKLNDSLLNSELTAKLSEMQAKYETEKKEKEILILQREKQESNTELEKQKVIKLIIIIVALIAVIIFSFIVFRIKSRQKRKQAMLENQALETEQKFLRAQMNPHFIFNSLNTVQSFVSENDSFHAMLFLSKFGQLLRNILENSRVNFISLENEIKTLRFYIELEQLRHQSVFDFVIDVDKNLDTEIIMIPPLIVQPFVENAIKHGLVPKKGGGELYIKISKKENRLEISVTDNGIGRKKAAELKRPGRKQHKSLGMQLTFERLKDLEEATGVDVKWHITDLYDKDGKAAGTKVTLIIPIL